MKLKELLKVINKYNDVEVLGKHFRKVDNKTSISDIYNGRCFYCLNIHDDYLECEVLEINHYRDRICVLIDNNY